MTVEDVLLKLWTNSESTLEKYDDKRLWMLLQNFVEVHGGMKKPAHPYDVRGGTKHLTKIEPCPQGILSRLRAKVTGG